jgi:hypothetical protein
MKNKTGWAGGTFGGVKKMHRTLWCGHLKEELFLKGLGVSLKMTLRWVLKK